MLKRRFSLMLCLLLVLSLLFTACGGVGTQPTDGTTAPIETTTGAVETTTGTEETTEPIEEIPSLDIDITAYTIVVPAAASDYERNAAKYVQREIIRRTKAVLPIVKDSEAVTENEILIGDTNRELSQTTMQTETSGLEYVVNCDEKAIALYGEQFVIAAAAYHFIDAYFDGTTFNGRIPVEPTVYTPTPKKANNYFILIGDGMGENHTLLFDKYDATTAEGSDGEDLFYGYLLPNQGKIITDSLSGTTDSAAAATALATGFTTINGYVGIDSGRNDLKSLTELGNELDFKTAVMSTEVSTGATPAGFSAHVTSRNDANGILEDQALLTDTVINCGLEEIEEYPADDIVREQLDELKNDKGIFMMYEEAYIDKHSHNNDMDSAFGTVVRFNQVIGAFMEYTFYNPNTVVIITADHETGGLTIDDAGEFSYTTNQHTNSKVNIFAYGVGTEMFNGQEMQNIEIPKFVSSCWGVTDFGDYSK